MTPGSNRPYAHCVTSYMRDVHRAQRAASKSASARVPGARRASPQGLWPAIRPSSTSTRQPVVCVALNA